MDSNLPVHIMAWRLTGTHLSPSPSLNQNNHNIYSLYFNIGLNTVNSKIRPLISLTSHLDGLFNSVLKEFHNKDIYTPWRLMVWSTKTWQKHHRENELILHDQRCPWTWLGLRSKKNLPHHITLANNIIFYLVSGVLSSVYCAVDITLASLHF